MAGAGGTLNKNHGKKGSPEKRDGILHLFSPYRYLKSQGTDIYVHSLLETG